MSDFINVNFDMLQSTGSYKFNDYSQIKRLLLIGNIIRCINAKRPAPEERPGLAKVIELVEILGSLVEKT